MTLSPKVMKAQSLLPIAKLTCATTIFFPHHHMEEKVRAIYNPKDSVISQVTTIILNSTAPRSTEISGEEWCSILWYATLLFKW